MKSLSAKRTYLISMSLNVSKIFTLEPLVPIQGIFIFRKFKFELVFNTLKQDLKQFVYLRMIGIDIFSSLY